MENKNMEAADGGGLSVEQKARISQKFKAAKALLSRKRRHDTLACDPQINVDGNLSDPSEILVNKSLPSHGNSFNRTNGECRSSFISADRSKSMNNGLSSKAILDLKSLNTAMRQPVSSTSKDPLLPQTILDNDLDDSILEEIDVLCVQWSAVKKERGDTNNHVKSHLNDGSGEENSSQKNLESNLETGGLYDALNSNSDVESIAVNISLETEDGPDPLNSKSDVESISVKSSLEAEVNDLVSTRAASRISVATQSQGMPVAYAKFLQSLNDKQYEAACTDISIPLMIVAGPGSGKTSTMVGRVLMLLNEGIGPSQILAMTFTTAAASEMRDRIGAVAGKAIAKELMISTFHSFSLQLCRLYAEKVDRTSDFLIYGHGQQKRAVIEAVRLLENEKGGQSSEAYNSVNSVNSPQYFRDKSKRWQKFVSQAKASGKNPSDCCKMGDKTGAAILKNYDDILKSCNALDYHDLISCSVKLLTDFPEVFGECQESWKAILIDEFQDTSSMQYGLLKILASHKRITIVGDDDQSIFSFNGADISGFDSFRKDFPNHKEIRLNKNYRSTRCIVEAASYLIQNNNKRCQLKNVLTDNSSGAKITVKDCHNEDAQCAFVVDKILEVTSNCPAAGSSFGEIAILYRRQTSGKVFQTAFRERKIPFNIHGVAFYRKKVVRSIIALLKTTVPGCDDGPFRLAFKALLPCDKEEKKRIVDHIDKVSTIRKHSFLSTASDIFSAKLSGTFKRKELTYGKKVLFTLDLISKLVHREQSISVVITSVANMLPQKYLLEQRAIVDADGGKLLNEDCDLRSVLQYLLDDVSAFISSCATAAEVEREMCVKESGCISLLKSFIDYLSGRESENFRSRRHDNENSVTLTTMHQSKGLEWDTVFIVKVNESEIPLLHECNGIAQENAQSLEEERRLLYVAMTRARKKLFILYIIMDTNWQMLQPSRFLKEIPNHLKETQGELAVKEPKANHQDEQSESSVNNTSLPAEEQCLMSNALRVDVDKASESTEPFEEWHGNSFLKRFNVEDRAVVSHLFHQWARKQAFQDPRRLLDKVGFVIDELLRAKKTKHKHLLHVLKSCLGDAEAFQYAKYVLRWLQIPADQRAHLMKEKQEHFQKLGVEKAMGSSAPSSKQIAYLRSLGCTIAPSSRLHASNLIEQYKSL